MGVSRAWAIGLLTSFGVGVAACGGSGGAGSSGTGGTFPAGTGAGGSHAGGADTGGTATGGSAATGGCYTGPGSCFENPYDAPKCCDTQTAKAANPECDCNGWHCPSGTTQCSSTAFCHSTADCAADEYCAHDGDCSSAGVCSKRPTSCAPDPTQVCTCSGQIVANLCTANAAGLDVGDVCPTSVLPCGPYFCSPDSEACAIYTDGSTVSYACVEPATVSTPLTCDDFYTVGCFSKCEADQSGRLTLWHDSSEPNLCLGPGACCSSTGPCACYAAPCSVLMGTPVPSCPP